MLPHPNIGDVMGICLTAIGMIAIACYVPSPPLLLGILAIGGVVTGVLHSYYERRSRH